VFEDPAFWALVGLVVFFGIIIYLKVPAMIGGTLDKRAATIRDELEQARRLREEAQALLAEYQRKAREAASEAEEIIDQAKREADALGAEARKRMEDYVASRTRMAEQKIAQAEHQAVQEVKALSADISIAAAQAILSAKVKGDAGAALVSRAIDDLRGKLN
jgi:F-type H+-transporting ATPase subunit b